MTGESRADIEREGRLVGGEVGGGIPLPLAFGAVADELFKIRAASFEELTGVVSKAMLLKEKRILNTAWRTWEDFTQDIVRQLEYRDIIRRHVLYGEVVWSLTEGFMRNRRYLVIPKADIGFTLWDEKNQDRGGDSEFEAELSVLVKRYQGLLKPTTMEVMQDTLSTLSRLNTIPAPSRVGTSERKAFVPKSRNNSGEEVVRDYDPTRMRECSQCGIEKPLTEEFFSRQLSRGWYTVRPQCRECKSKKNIARKKAQRGQHDHGNA